MPSAPRLYLNIREIAQHNRPVLVTRDEHMTLATWDPRDSRQDVLAACLDLLDEGEQHQLWSAYGLTLPLPPWTSRRESLCLFVPAVLRLHDASGYQGGAELERRIASGEIVLEQALALGEAFGEPVDLQKIDDLTYA